jgi:hypothetical protein
MDPQMVAILNALKGPPGNILLALISHSRPLGTNELVTLTGWCESSVIAGLQKLERLGWVERQARYNGWALVRTIRVAVIPKIFAVPELALPPGEDSPGNREIHRSQPSGEPEGVQEPGGNREIYRSNRTPGLARPAGRQVSRASQGSPPLKARASPARRCPPVKKYRSERKKLGSQSTEESQEEDSTLQTPDLSSSSDSHSAPPAGKDSPGCPDPPLSCAQVPRILAATRQLFGERVMGDPARYPDPARLLAAIAEAYQNRRVLRKPARVVFKNLKNDRDISPEYLEDPLSFLPESFLQEAGLPRPRSPVRSAYSRYLAGLPDPASGEREECPAPSPLPDPDPSLSLPVSDPPARPAAEAWTMAQSILETQLDPGLFEKHLAGASLVRYDFPLNVFTVAVRDAYCRDWLQERLGKLAGRLLNGICGRPASVLFVAGDEIAEEHG